MYEQYSEKHFVLKALHNNCPTENLLIHKRGKVNRSVLKEKVKKDSIDLLQIKQAMAFEFLGKFRGT